MEILNYNTMTNPNLRKIEANNSIIFYYPDNSCIVHAFSKSRMINSKLFGIVLYEKY